MHPLLRSLIAAVATVVALGAAPPQPVPVPVPRPHIRGRVFDAATKAPLPDAFVGIFFLPPGPAKADDPERIADAVRIDPWITADGSFDIEIPEEFGPGSEVFLFAQARAHAEWRMADWPKRMRDAKPVIVSNTDATVDVALKRGETIEGIVTDAGGHPLAGVHVNLHVAARNSATWTVEMAAGTPFAWPDDVVSDEQGRWLLVPIGLGNALRLFGGRGFLTFQHDRMAPAVVSIDDLQPLDGVLRIRTILHAGTELTGVVVGPEGVPVAGARVTVAPSPYDSRFSRIAHEATTNATGGFTLRGLDPGAHTVRVFAAGFESLETRIAVGQGLGAPTAGGPAAPWTLRLVPGLTIRGRVLRSDGRPLPYLGMGVQALAPHATDYVPVATTGADGSFEFAGAPRSALRLFPLGHVFRARTITPPTSPLELRVAPRREVVVEFVDERTGEPVHVEGTATLWSESLSEVAAYDDADRATFGLVLDGTYELHVSATDYLGVTQPITVRPGPGREVVRCSLGKGFALTGRVTDTRGAPVAGASVYATGPGRWSQRSTETDEDGKYRLSGLDDSQALVGNAYLIVIVASGKAMAFNLETFAAFSIFDRALDFTLEDGATVRGQVTSADGTPVVGTFVRANPKELFVKVPLQVSADSTDADGRYELRNVPSGSVAITFGSETRSLSLQDGETRVLDVTLPRSPVASPPGSR